MIKQQLNFNPQKQISSLTLDQLKLWVRGQKQIEDFFIKKLKNDPRKGTTRLARECIKKNKAFKQEKERVKSLKKIEKDLHNKGYKYIAGVDEAGKGALAGPVTAGAVIFPENIDLLKVNDSKKLTTKQRESLYNKIVDRALSVGIGMVSVEKINQMGIATANRLAMKKALDNLVISPDFVLIDCIKIDGLGYPRRSIPKGDSKCYSIAAASIIAKVTRDRLMVKLSKKYPEYGLEHNKGYGTKEHKKAVESYGYSRLHREKFKFHTVSNKKIKLWFDHKNI